MASSQICTIVQIFKLSSRVMKKARSSELSILNQDKKDVKSPRRCPGNRWSGRQWQPHSSTIMSSWCRRAKSSFSKYSMESGLRRVGTHDGHDTLSGWWCRKRLWKKKGQIHMNKPAIPKKIVLGIVEDSKETIRIRSQVVTPHLHVCMVGGMEGLIQWCRTLAFTAIRIVALGVNNPLVPADVVKVHPHVHPPA